MVQIIQINNDKLYFNRLIRATQVILKMLTDLSAIQHILNDSNFICSDSYFQLNFWLHYPIILANCSPGPIDSCLQCCHLFSLKIAILLWQKSILLGVCATFASVSVAFVYSCSWCLIKEANFIFAFACALRFDNFSKQLKRAEWMEYVKWENENA